MFFTIRSFGIHFFCMRLFCPRKLVLTISGHFSLTILFYLTSATSILTEIVSKVSFFTDIDRPRCQSVLCIADLVALEIQLFQMPYIESNLIWRKLRADRTTTIAMSTAGDARDAMHLEPKPTQKTYNAFAWQAKLPQIIYLRYHILYNI